MRTVGSAFDRLPKRERERDWMEASSSSAAIFPSPYVRRVEQIEFFLSSNSLDSFFPKSLGSRDPTEKHRPLPLQDYYILSSFDIRFDRDLASPINSSTLSYVTGINFLPLLFKLVRHFKQSFT